MCMLSNNVHVHVVQPHSWTVLLLMIQTITVPQWRLSFLQSWECCGKDKITVMLALVFNMAWSTWMQAVVSLSVWLACTQLLYSSGYQFQGLCLLALHRRFLSTCCSSSFWRTVKVEDSVIVFSSKTFLSHVTHVCDPYLKLFWLF